MKNHKLSKRKWIIEVMYILVRKYKYRREEDARGYAEALAKTYYEYYEPEDAIKEDFSYS